MKTLKLHEDNIHQGSLILVNRDWPLKAEPSDSRLVPLECGKAPALLERQAAKMLAKTLAAVDCVDEIVAISGFRMMREQQRIYNRSLRENGRRFTREYVALPGCSEHQTGLAVDMALNAAAIDFIRPYFPYEGICQRFRERATDYGFIERYPAGRESVTHIAHEPWHFRYVGYPHSKIMTDRGMTLEEYTDYIRLYDYHHKRLKFSDNGPRCEIGFIPLHADTVVEAPIPEHMAYQLSGNNVDGTVVTLWEIGREG
jgi:D-alanyl-D-alanine dipeptidase/carboxypeptidase